MTPPDLGLHINPGTRVVLPDTRWVTIADYKTHREVTGIVGDYPDVSCVTVKTKQSGRWLHSALPKGAIFVGVVETETVEGDSGELYRLIDGRFTALTP